MIETEWNRNWVGQNSLDFTATRRELDGPGIESR